EHGGTLRETDGSLPETRPEREIVADSSPVPVRAGIFRLSSKKDRKFLRVRAAKCARFAACFGSLSGASRWDRSWPRLRGLHASGLMANMGLTDELNSLKKKYRLDASMSSMRAVGYRQVWEYLEGRYDKEALREKALAATRQLAKR